MEISDLVYQVGVLTNSKDYHKPAVAKAYIKAKQRWIDIMEMPVWQTIGSPLLSDEEVLNRAYSSNDNFYYDGDEKYM